MRTPEIIQAELQRKISEIEQEELQGNNANVSQLEIWRADKTNLEAELVTARADQDRIVKHVEANGYIMDSLMSGTYTMAELAHTPDDYTLQAIAVQVWALEQQDSFDRTIALLQSNLEVVTNDLRIQLEAKDELSRQLHQAMLEKHDAESKRDNISKLYHELQEQIKHQEAGTLPTIASLTPEEQDALWKAENAKLNNRIKVTSIRIADSTGIDTSKSIATLALGGEEEFPSIYKSRYIIISESEALQLRGEYEQKKADIQLSVPKLAEIEIEPVSEVVDLTKESTFQDQIHQTYSRADTETTRDTALDEAMGQKESQVTLESLQAQVDAIMIHVGMAA